MFKNHNLRDIWIVTKFTAQEMLNRKSFRISTLIVLVLIVVGFNIPNLIQNFSDDSSNNIVLLSDPENIFENQLDQFESSETELGLKFENTPMSLDEIKNKINHGDINSAILIARDDQDQHVALTYVVRNTATLEQIPTEVLNALDKLYTNIQLSKLNLTPQELARLNANFSLEVEQAESQEIGGNIGVMMILSCLLFFAIYFCAFQVSSAITIEKTSKIIESLVTSTSPRTIILGKTIGIGLVGLGQLLLFAVTAIICAHFCLDPELLAQMFDLSNFTPLLALATLVYFILGYFAYALLYALTGSTVSKPEDVQSANTPVVIITMIGFYLSYFTLLNPTSNLNLLAAILPISSPFCMPLRIMMGVATGWEVACSIAVLLVFCWLVSRFAIKIYSNAILNYGTKISLRNLFRLYKQK